MKTKRLAFILFLVLVGGLGAEPRFRADDGNLWRLADNPALEAVSGDLFAFGAASQVGPDWRAGNRDLQLISPFVSFRYTWNEAAETMLRFGTSLGPWEGLSLGYRRDEATKGGVKDTHHQFGLLYRPFDVVSTGLTLDDAFGLEKQWGAGVGIRPLRAFSPQGDWLTLTADVAWPQASLVWERVGGRVSWQGSDLRVWYELTTGRPGVELTVAIGPGETTAELNRVGTALRWSTKTPQIGSFGPILLKIEGTSVLGSTASPSNPLFSGASRWSLPKLLATLERAAGDPQVAAVIFEGPPSVGGQAGAAELRAALEKLKKAGKKTYVHSDSFGDSLGFQGWASAADRVSLDPTGSLWLTASGARRLYLKDFFDKIGVQFVNLAPWETKSANNALTFGQMPDGERAMLKRYLSDRDSLAASALASGRQGRLKKDATTLIAQGPYLVAQEALDAGLIDALESRADFAEFLAKEHPGASTVTDLVSPIDTGWGPSLARKTVALVHLAGDITGGKGQAGQSIGRAAAEAIKALREDKTVHALLLRVDSPGGAVLPSDALAQEVKKTVAAGKPVVVVMGDVAASGGYYLSAPASRIFAQPGTLTGSIGVTAALFTAEKALGLLGVKADGVDQGASSSFGDWTRPLTPADRTKWNAMIDATYQRFLDVVAEGRHLDKARLEPLARGQIYTGREALTLGLVDELGGQAEAKAWLETTLGGPVEWRELTPGDNNPWGNLLSPLATALVQASDSPTLKLAQALDPVVAPWASALEGVVARGPGPLVWVDLRP